MAAENHSNNNKGSNSSPTTTVAATATNPTIAAIVQQDELPATSSDSSVFFTDKDSTGAGAGAGAAIDIDEVDAEKLSTMVGDKDVSILRGIGGTSGLLQCLNVDADMGLSSSEGTVAAAATRDENGAAVATTEQHLKDMHTAYADLAKELASELDPSDNAAWVDEFEKDCKLYTDRVEKYGVNILPPTKSQSFLSLVWDALHDKMLILLIVAAVVSLGIGIYQDVRVTGNKIEDSQNVHWVEGFAIIVAISVVTLVGSINDFQKEKQFRKLNAKKNDRRVKVTRNGQECLISTNCILVGDILHIEPGDIMCADAVVLSSSNLKCDESSVTGESDAMKKQRLEVADKVHLERKDRRKRRRAELRSKRNEQRAYALRLKETSSKIEEIEPAVDDKFHVQSGADADESTDGEDMAPPPTAIAKAGGDEDTIEKLKRQQQQQQQPAGLEKQGSSGKAHQSSNKRIDPFLISGSRVLEGVGLCVVVAVGQQSFYGRTLMALRGKGEITPLQAKLNNLAELIAKLGGAAGLLMFLVLVIKYAVQLGRNETSRNATKVADSIVRIIISAVTVVVVAVPEGLPLAVTLALAVATMRMLKDNCLVRVLASCETMGNATTICSDKTGTLTQNRMTVVSGCIGDQYQFSSYPPGTSAMQRRQARQPPADGLVTDMTGRAVPPEKAVLPTFLETETRRQKRLRSRRNRQHRRRMHRAAAGGSGPLSGHSSSSAFTPTSDATPSFSDLSDYSDDEDLIVPTAELGEEAPLAVMNLCHDAIAVNSTAFIPAGGSNVQDGSESPDQPLLGGGQGAKKYSLMHRFTHPSLWFGKGKSKSANSGEAGQEEMQGEFAGAASSADKFTGSKTETALLSWSETLGAPEYSQLRDKDIDEHVQVWPFSSERKSMSTLVKIRRREDGKTVWRLYVKGAPEMVIQGCRWIVDVDGAFQTQDNDEILNEQNNDSSQSATAVAESASNQHQKLGGDTEDADDEADLDDESSPRQLHIDIPQINLDQGSDDEEDENGGMRERTTVESTPYLLSAHYTGSRNTGSDTTDVADDALLAGSFPADFAHNPAIPVLPLDEETLYDLRRTITDYASRALRTIGMAYRDFETFDEALLSQHESDGDWRESAGMVCLGIFAIEDPLREGVADAVRSCQNAGIIVRMVTGDNVLTAKAIATQCGIFTPGMGGIVLEGPKFRKLSPEQMDFIVPRLQVLARSSPEDKRMLVEWLRTHGEVVSVTGDGTNDGPALKAANVGFSMGIAGTEVAKEASSIVVMDDNFKSIVRACLWGRTVNDAVKKFLQFQVTVNITAVLIAFVSSIADKEEKSVFTAVQLLWINLIMDTFAALALATDPPHDGMLDRYPEKQGSPLITFTMWKHIIGQSIFQVVVCFLTLYAADDIFHLHTVQSKYDMLVLRTLVFNTFAWMQIFNEFNCRVLRNELNCFRGMQKNWFFMGIVLISVLGQIIIVQWGGVAFQTTALGGKYWAFSMVAGFLSLPVGLVLRLLPDQLIWWVMPFVSQDIYKEPQSLEWHPPAQTVRNKLAGNNGAALDDQQLSEVNNNNNDDDDDLDSRPARPRRRLGGGSGQGSGSGSGGHHYHQYGRGSSNRPINPENLINASGQQGGDKKPKQGLSIKSSVAKISADISKRVVRYGPASKKDDNDISSNLDNSRKENQDADDANGSTAGQDANNKTVIAAAMVPSMVASSIGIGMSTSSMPPNRTIEELVDQELEKQDKKQ